MKKMIAMFAIAAIFAACNSKTQESTEEVVIDTVEAVEVDSTLVEQTEEVVEEVEAEGELASEE